MLNRITRSNNKYIPIAIGAAAVAVGAVYIAQSNKFSIMNDSPKVFIGDNQWIDLKIAKIEDVSHDSRRFTFHLPTADSETGLPLASAILAKFVTPKGSNVIRPYTPVSDISDKGTMQLVIKHYNGGKMTDHLFGLKQSDTVSFKGPIPKWHWVPNSFESITLIGGGSGVTPLYQLVHHIATNPMDKTKINLLLANKTPSDILLRKELDDLQAKYPEQVNVTYFVDKPDNGFKGETGFISKDYISKTAAKPTEKTHLFVCGPPPFMEAYSGSKPSPMDQGQLTGILSDLGYTIDQVFKF